MKSFHREGVILWASALRGLLYLRQIYRCCLIASFQDFFCCFEGYFQELFRHFRGKKQELFFFWVMRRLFVYPPYYRVWTKKTYTITLFIVYEYFIYEMMTRYQAVTASIYRVQKYYSFNNKRCCDPKLWFNYLFFRMIKQNDEVYEPTIHHWR